MLITKRIDNICQNEESTEKQAQDSKLCTNCHLLMIKFWNRNLAKIKNL